MADDIRHVQSDETCPKVVVLPTIDQNDSDLHPPDIRRVATGFHTKIVLPPNWAFVSTLQLSRSHWTLLHLCRSRTHYGNFRLLPLPLGHNSSQNQNNARLFHISASHLRRGYTGSPCHWWNILCHLPFPNDFKRR